jgi:DNA polymerase I-like protein with 3'-5' exonuclease and polymerase domains
VTKYKYRLGQLGLFVPESNWQPPAELPDLRGRPVVALDCETKDVGLIEKRGPGWAFDAGFICGVSWAAEDSVGYAPIQHPDTATVFTNTQVMRWLTDLAKSGTPLVFHNAPYDCGWMECMLAGMTGANINDTLAACVLVDENEYAYDLDSCCKRAGLPGKDIALLEEAVEAMGADRRKARESIWQLPAKYAGPYAEADTAATLALWQHTAPKLHEQELMPAYTTEMGLVPMVIAMRRRGIRIDVPYVHKLIDEYSAVRDAALAQVGELLELRRPASMKEIRSPGQMEQWFTREHIVFPRTVKAKQGSFTKDWMEKHNHPLPRACAVAEIYEEARTKFLENFLLGYEIDGRIHAEIHQYRSDAGGTRSHRLSYSEPPLQQMPSPDKNKIGKQIRKAFLPEQGERWVALDYSQQEPRLTVHFASRVGAAGAEAAVQRYIDDPRTDYHSMVAEMTGQPRPVAKILNLAMTYGKGKRSLADELGLSLNEAEVLLQDYHNRLPFIKSLEDKCKIAANLRGYIRLIDGARMHYPQWEGGYVEWEDRLAAEAKGMRLTPCTYEEAQERAKNPEHPWSRSRLRRADTRKSLNNLVQGSAARQTKRAMLACWREGIVPLVQMHDEIDLSTADKALALRAQQIMVETTPLVVPTIVDFEVGPTWGEAKQNWE